MCAQSRLFLSQWLCNCLSTLLTLGERNHRLFVIVIVSFLLCVLCGDAEGAMPSLLLPPTGRPWDDPDRVRQRQRLLLLQLLLQLRPSPHHWRCWLLPSSSPRRYRCHPHCRDQLSVSHKPTQKAKWMGIMWKQMQITNKFRFSKSTHHAMHASN